MQRGEKNKTVNHSNRRGENGGEGKDNRTDTKINYWYAPEGLKAKKKEGAEGRQKQGADENEKDMKTHERHRQKRTRQRTTERGRKRKGERRKKEEAGNHQNPSKRHTAPQGKCGRTISDDGTR